VANVREYRIDEVVRKFAMYENNFTLKLSPAAHGEPHGQQCTRFVCPPLIMVEGGLNNCLNTRLCVVFERLPPMVRP
jgi:hypothetical protein